MDRDRKWLRRYKEKIYIPHKGNAKNEIGKLTSIANFFK